MTDNHVGDAAARFIAGAPGRSYEDDVLDMAKRCLVDWLGVAIGAVDEPVSRAVRDTVAGWAATGRARILLGPRTAPALAALVNGTMGHAFDFDDTRAHAASHLSSPTWAATLAVAGASGLDGKAAIGAFISGYEVAAVLGDSGFDAALQKRGFHPTAIFGRLAAAASTAALMQLDADRVAHALGVAGTTAGGLNASFGTMAKPFHSGKAAMDGVLAAELAANGFAAARHLLDDARGLVGTLTPGAGVSLDSAAFTDGRSLFDNSFKPYSCGKLIHGHIDAAAALRDAVAGRPIRQIRCQVAPIGERLVGRPIPATPLEGKFSIAFCVALALLGYPVLPGDFSDERIADPAIRGLMERVELTVNPEVDQFGAIVDIVLEDGEALHMTVPRSLGNPENPVSWDDLHGKFDGLVGPVLGERSGALYDALTTIDRPGALDTVLALIEPPERITAG